MVEVCARAIGAGSQIEIEQTVFHVVSFRDRLISRLEIHFDRETARASLGLEG